MPGCRRIARKARTARRPGSSLILLLWVVCYPAYLYKRRHYGFANLLVPGLVIGAVYLGSWLLMDVAIVEARAGLQNPFR